MHGRPMLEGVAGLYPACPRAGWAAVYPWQAEHEGMAVRFPPTQIEDARGFADKKEKDLPFKKLVLPRGEIITEMRPSLTHASI